ncbi:MAG: tetratricopeptide repeat protein [Candidatus Hermodarchaeota archaeon]
MVETTSIIDYFYQNGYIDNKNSSNYLELFHDLVIQLINKEKYDELVDLCYDVFSFDPNIKLIPKLIFTLINLKVNKSVVDLCELYLRNKKNDEIFYEAINEFLKYNNFSGAIDLCQMYIRVNPKGNLGFIRTMILASLKKKIKDPNVFELIEALLEVTSGIKFIYNLIHSMLEIQNYNAVINIIKLVLKSNSKEKLSLMNIVNILFENGKFRGAWELCQKFIKIYPSSIDVLILYGRILTKRGEYQQSQILFNSILKQVPSSKPRLKSKILNFIGWNYIQQGDWIKATSPCIKSTKLNPKYPDSFNNLGYIYFKKGYVEKGIKLVKRALELNPNICQTWITLGKIYMDLRNYYDAFIACYKCLSLNNQHYEGISLYKKLSNNTDLKILSFLIPKMIKLGYRCVFDSLNETIFPNKLLKNNRYIVYSEEFLNFLKKIRLAQMYLNDFVAIYCWLPKCESCEKILKIYGERINYKDSSKTKMYRCENCGKEKRSVERLDNENIPYLKLRVIFRSSLQTHEKRTQFYSKLDYESIFITYSTFNIIQNNSDSKLSELIDNLKSAVLLYGEDFQKKLLEIS